MDIIRLSKINRKLDPIVQFDDDDDKKRNPLAVATGAAAAGGAAYGGYRANQAIRTRQGAMNAVVPGARTSYGAAAKNLYQSNVAPAVRSAGEATGGFIEKLLAKMRGVKLASRTERLIQLNQALAKIIELESPLASFDKSHAAIMQKYKDTYDQAKGRKKQAKVKQREAKTAMIDASLGSSPEHPAIQRKLHRESYIRRGVGIGAIAGATTGSIAGARVGRRILGRGAGTVAGGLYGGLTGAMLGAGGGMQVGGRIRRAKPLPPGKYGIEDYKTP